MYDLNYFKDKCINDYNIVCFWKEFHNNGYLSNWFKSSFVINGIKYNCMEQYFMAEKAMLFNDEESRNKILKSNKPNQQKAIGRKVKNFNEQVWNENKINISLIGLRAKFKQNPELKKQLLNTQNSILIEASPYDRVWGAGLNEEQIKYSNFNKWKGQNILGFLLMKVRDEFKYEED